MKQNAMKGKHVNPDIVDTSTSENGREQSGLVELIDCLGKANDRGKSIFRDLAEINSSLCPTPRTDANEVKECGGGRLGELRTYVAITAAIFDEMSGEIEILRRHVGG